MPKRGRKIKAKSKKSEAEIENIDEEKIERGKRLFMWVGVGCVMAIFFVVWLFNLKYQFRINSQSGGKNTFNWQETKAELDKAMGQVKQGLAEIKQLQKNSAPAAPPELTPEQINLLKSKLIDEAATSTTASSTSASSIK